MSSFDMDKKLIHLDLSHNTLSGAIPSSLFAILLLQSIQLPNNQFSQLDGFKSMSSMKTFPNLLRNQFKLISLS